MLDLEEIKRVYKLREQTSLKIQNQLELIRKVLGNHFIYKDFEYFIPTEILDIDDVDDVGDGIVDILYIDGGLDVVLRHMDEELLRMNEEEYFFPNELLSMTGYEAKELYADTLAKVEEEKKQYYINNLKNDIKMYEKSLTEKKKQLEELEKELES